MTNSGVYKINNCVTGDCYIGSSCNIRKRWNYHKSRLRKGLHANKHFQRAWDKYKEKNFSFIVLEFCSNEECLKVEEKFINSLKPSYNKRFVPYSNLGLKMSEQTKKKMSQKAKERMTPELIKILREGLNTPEFKKKNKEHLDRIRPLSYGVPRKKKVIETPKLIVIPSMEDIGMKSKYFYNLFLKRIK